MKKQVKLWIDFAENDLRSAKKLIEDPLLIQAAAFHCQQAVENFLKSAFEHYNIRIPKIHNLEVLLAKISQYYKVEIDEQILKKLDEVYIDSRYPADVGLIPDGIPAAVTIKEFIDFVGDIKEKILRIIDNGKVLLSTFASYFFDRNKINLVVINMNLF